MPYTRSACLLLTVLAAACLSAAKPAAAGAYTYSTISGPGDHATVATSINAAGQVVGYYGDTNGQHAFIATPDAVPEASSAAAFGFTLLGLAGLIVCAVKRRRLCTQCRERSLFKSAA